jgi:hypothetical protein
MTQMIRSLSRQQKVCLLVIEVVTALGYVQLLREATKPSATKNEAFSNKNPGADEDFPLLYILYERLCEKEKNSVEPKNGCRRKHTSTYDEP